MKQSHDLKPEKTVIEKLLDLRRNLSEPEQRFAQPRLDDLIRELRSLAAASPEQIEKAVLYSIEVQGAVTETEISEDTRIHRQIINATIKKLVEAKILYYAKRHVPGMDRPRYILKSRRIGSPEAF